VGVCDKGTCTTKAVLEGTVCADGNPCTVGDTCDGKGGCKGAENLCPC
jgi:hypothetical protein